MPRPAQNIVYQTLAGVILAQTEKAVRMQVYTVNNVPLKGVPATNWYPISQCCKVHRSATDAFRDHSDYIMVADWLCKKNGLYAEGSSNSEDDYEEMNPND